MTRTLIVHSTFRVEGEREPEWVITLRIPWPDDQTLEEVADAAVEKICQQRSASKRMAIERYV
jgi:hypothetical protein